jgi:hypothetical protein
VGREAEWKREFIAAHPERDYLMVDNNSIFWITHLVSSTPVLQARERKNIIEFNFRNRTFNTIYVFQTFEVNPDTGRLKVLKDEDMGPAYRLEKVTERRFTPFRLSRISRVIGVDPAVEPRWERSRASSSPPLLDGMSEAEREKIRKAYLERFIQKLP